MAKMSAKEPVLRTASTENALTVQITVAFATSDGQDRIAVLTANVMDILPVNLKVLDFATSAKNIRQVRMQNKML